MNMLFEIGKLVAALVSSAAVSAVTKEIVINNIPKITKMNSFMVGLGTTVIAGAMGQIGGTYVAGQIDQVAKLVKGDTSNIIG